jgi:predicted aspartyl protease
VPPFSAESPNLEVEGPQVNVQVGLLRAAIRALEKEGASVPDPVAGIGLIDTGASGTAVRTGMLSSLGLHPVGKAPVLTPTTGSKPVYCPMYAVTLMLPNGRIEIPVLETPLDGQNIDVLIGRDVLKHGLFVYQGHSSQFTLSF